MLKNEFTAIIANGENSSVKFKRDDSHSEQLVKAIAAIAPLQRVMKGIAPNG
ncbi:MAG: hypothetical protein FD130_2382 [Halothiobacillaceae bacterium]|nr:MAG: hypothetical protein FD130_2382 [Halothiobacillaceae bacterium]